MFDIGDDEAPGTVLYVAAETSLVRDEVKRILYSFSSKDLRPDVLRYGGRGLR